MKFGYFRILQDTSAPVRAWVKKVSKSFFETPNISKQSFRKYRPGISRYFDQLW
jgi:hypothetical protein